MKKRVLAVILLIPYSVVLIRVIVFKHLPVIRVGKLIFNLGGAHQGEANLMPFRSIMPYLLLKRGLLMAVVNLGGNIFLFVPVGFLLPVIYRYMNWKKALLLSIATGVAMEGMQVAFHVGIVDIDDVILNAFGVMIGYWVYLWVKSLFKSNRINSTIVADS